MAKVKIVKKERDPPPFTSKPKSWRYETFIIPPATKL
jgi:hypothetical protein